MSRYLEYCSSWRKRQNQSRGLLLSWSYDSWITTTNAISVYRH